MPLTVKEIRHRIVEYKKAHAPAISKLRRFELIKFAMSHQLLTEKDITKRDYAIFLNQVEPSTRSKKTVVSPILKPASPPPTVEPFDTLLDRTANEYIKKYVARMSGKSVHGPEEEMNEARLLNLFFNTAKNNYGFEPVDTYKRAISALKSKESNQSVPPSHTLLTHDEVAQYDALIADLKKRGESVKTPQDIKHYKKLVQKTKEDFNASTSNRAFATSQFITNMKKLLESQQLLKPEPKPEVKTASTMSIFSRPSAPPIAPSKISEPVTGTHNWREKLDFFDERNLPQNKKSSMNMITKLDPNIDMERGFKWLDSKYGPIYHTAIKKVKAIADGTAMPIDKMTPKMYKEFSTLPFENPKQMNQFFTDVLFADPIIYHILHYNATSKKAPSYTSAYRDFTKWNKTTS